MTLIGGGTSHRVAACAATALTGIRLSAGVAVTAGTAIGFGRVRAGAIGRVTSPSYMALIGGGADYRVRTSAGPRLTGITLRTGIAIVTARAVRLRRRHA